MKRIITVAIVTIIAVIGRGLIGTARRAVGRLLPEHPGNGNGDGSAILNAAGYLHGHQSTGPSTRHHGGENAPFDEDWRAILDNQVVGRGSSMGEALRQARERGHDDPRLIPVLPDETTLL